jgi:copper(I)-binding protein
VLAFLHITLSNSSKSSDSVLALTTFKLSRVEIMSMLCLDNIMFLLTQDLDSSKHINPS